MLGLGTLSRVVGEIRGDVAAARDRDRPRAASARSRSSPSWAGVQAILAHRVAHALHGAGVPLVPMAIAYASRAVTGIEIHPAARSATSSSSTTAPAS